MLSHSCSLRTTKTQDEGVIKRKCKEFLIFEGKEDNNRKKPQRSR